MTNKAAHQLIYGKRSLMDNETLQQLYYAIPFLSKWVGSGSDIWGFSYASPVKTDVKLNGRYVDTEELSDYAIQAKRSGDYAEAIGAYFQTMMACMNKNGKINAQITNHALEKMDIDELGLDAIDRKMLKTMIENFKGKPVGLDTLGAFTGEEPDTIEDVYEPYLLQIGFIARTPRGRIPLEPAYNHLGYKIENIVK